MRITREEDVLFIRFRDGKVARLEEPLESSSLFRVRAAATRGPWSQHVRGSFPRPCLLYDVGYRGQ